MEKKVLTTCPYCGAGCQFYLVVDEAKNKILRSEPANGRTNEGTLCLKGHYGWDFLNDPQKKWCFRRSWMWRSYQLHS